MSMKVGMANFWIQSLNMNAGDETDDETRI